MADPTADQATDPRFLVAGCGRSGTGYTARLLTLLGLPCGHEQLFNPDRIAAGQVHWPEHIPGESSWLAVPFLGQLPSTTRVLHQVRDPLDQIRSSVRIKFFEFETAYREFAEQVCPPLTAGTVLERSARYWLHWNTTTEQAASQAGMPYLRYRLEDLDGEQVARLMEFLGARVDRAQIEAVLASHPRTFNSRGDKSADDAVTLDALPTELRAAVEVAAERYGYARDYSRG